MMRSEKEKNRDLFPDFSNEKTFDFNVFADGLLEDMGFPIAPQPIEPQPEPAVPQPRLIELPPECIESKPEPAAPAPRPVEPSPEPVELNFEPAMPRPAPVESRPIVSLEPSVQTVPAALPVDSISPPPTQSEPVEPSYEVSEAAVSTAKKRKTLSHSTRFNHIRFIIIVVAIFLAEMLLIGFLTSQGILDIDLLH
jgi:hypothetical protein